MASASPPSKILGIRPGSLLISSANTTQAPALAEALNFFDQLHEQGIVLAPAMPTGEALASAAKQLGISERDALMVYLSILNHE